MFLELCLFPFSSSLLLPLLAVSFLFSISFLLLILLTISCKGHVGASPICHSRGERAIHDHGPRDLPHRAVQEALPRVDEAATAGGVVLGERGVVRLLLLLRDDGLRDGGGVEHGGGAGRGRHGCEAGSRVRVRLRRRDADAGALAERVTEDAAPHWEGQFACAVPRRGLSGRMGRNHWKQFSGEAVDVVGLYSVTPSVEYMFWLSAPQGFNLFIVSAFQGTEYPEDSSIDTAAARVHAATASDHKV